MPVSLAGSSSSSMLGAIVPISGQSVSNINGFDAIYFNNIPQIYKTLMVVCSVRGSSPFNNFQDIQLRLNNTISGTTFSNTNFFASNAVVTTNRNSNETFGMNLGSLPSLGNTNNIYGTTIYYIPQYTNSSYFKTVLMKSASDVAGTGVVKMGVGTFSSTSPITALNVYNNGSFPNYYNTAYGSTISLYGIRGVGQ
jgi:hypothetical protein